MCVCDSQVCEGFSSWSVVPGVQAFQIAKLPLMASVQHSWRNSLAYFLEIASFRRTGSLHLSQLPRGPTMKASTSTLSKPLEWRRALRWWYFLSFSARAARNESEPSKGIVTSTTYASFVTSLRTTRSGLRPWGSPGTTCSLNCCPSTVEPRWRAVSGCCYACGVGGQRGSGSG